MPPKTTTTTPRLTRQEKLSRAVNKVANDPMVPEATRKKAARFLDPARIQHGSRASADASIEFRRRSREAHGRKTQTHDGIGPLVRRELGGGPSSQPVDLQGSCAPVTIVRVQPPGRR